MLQLELNYTKELKLIKVLFLYMCEHDSYICKDVYKISKIFILLVLLYKCNLNDSKNKCSKWNIFLAYMV